MKRSLPRLVRGTILVAALGLVASGPALAWDPDAHESIVRLALAISPAAEARVGGNWDAFYAAVREPDPYDKACHGHPGLPSPRDPSTVTAQLLEQVQAGKMIPSAHLRAQVLGRMAHFAADAAVPYILTGDESVTP